MKYTQIEIHDSHEQCISSTNVNKNKDNIVCIYQQTVVIA